MLDEQLFFIHFDQTDILLNTMHETMKQLLRPIQVRLQARRLILHAGLCALLSLCVLLLLSLLAPSFLAVSFSPTTALLGSLTIGLLFAARIIFYSHNNRQESARRIDDHYRLQDRMTTACELLKKHPAENDLTPNETLQIKDAIAKLPQLRPAKIVPFSFVIFLPLLAFALLSGFSFSNSFAQPPKLITDKQTTDKPVIKINQSLDKILATPSSLFSSHKDWNPIDDLLAEINASSLPPRDRMKLLSQLEEKLNAIQSELAKHDQSPMWNDLTNAFSDIPSLQNLTNQLSQKQFGKAAKTLQKTNLEKLSHLERTTLKTNLAQKQKQAHSHHDEQYHRLMQELSHLFSKQKTPAFKKAFRQLAKQAEKQAGFQKKNRAIRTRLQSVQFAKMTLAQSQDVSSDRSQNGGFRAGTSPGTTRKTPSSAEPLSTPPENKISLPLPSNPNDAISSLHPTNRQPNGSSKGTPSSRLQKFQKQIEQAEQNEQYPIGYRILIRDYFEQLHNNQQHHETQP